MICNNSVINKFKNAILNKKNSLYDYSVWQLIQRKVKYEQYSNVWNDEFSSKF